MSTSYQIASVYSKEGGDSLSGNEEAQMRGKDNKNKNANRHCWKWATRSQKLAGFASFFLI
jgi:hypothetical protein